MLNIDETTISQLNESGSIVAMHSLNGLDSAQIERDVRLTLRKMGVRDMDDNRSNARSSIFQSKLSKAAEEECITLQTYADLLSQENAVWAYPEDKATESRLVLFTKINRSIPYDAAFQAASQHGWRQGVQDVMDTIIDACYVKKGIRPENRGIIIYDNRLYPRLEPEDRMSADDPETYRRVDKTVFHITLHSLLLGYAKKTPGWQVIPACVDNLEIEPVSGLPISRSGGDRFLKWYDQLAFEVAKAIIGEGAEGLSFGEFSAACSEYAFTRLRQT